VNTFFSLSDYLSFFGPLILTGFIPKLKIYWMFLLKHIFTSLFLYTVDTEAELLTRNGRNVRGDSWIKVTLKFSQWKCAFLLSLIERE
jgi:hypothetical protein